MALHTYGEFQQHRWIEYIPIAGAIYDLGKFAKKEYEKFILKIPEVSSTAMPKELKDRVSVWSNFTRFCVSLMPFVGGLILAVHDSTGDADLHRAFWVAGVTGNGTQQLMEQIPDHLKYSKAFYTEEKSDNYGFCYSVLGHNPDVTNFIPEEFFGDDNFINDVIEKSRNLSFLQSKRPDLASNKKFLIAALKKYGWCALSGIDENLRKDDGFFYDVINVGKQMPRDILRYFPLQENMEILRFLAKRKNVEIVQYLNKPIWGNNKAFVLELLGLLKHQILTTGWIAGPGFSIENPIKGNTIALLNHVDESLFDDADFIAKAKEICQEELSLASTLVKSKLGVVEKKLQN